MNESVVGIHKCYSVSLYSLKFKIANYQWKAPHTEPKSQRPLYDGLPEASLEPSVSHLNFQWN